MCFKTNTKMTQTELEHEINSRTWYHTIDLGNGLRTPGRQYEPIWQMIRDCRSQIDYSGKYVLDIASFDGMWAFEAEELGAAQVVATDTFFAAYDNLLLAREVRRSKVIPFYNTSIYRLRDSLAQYIEEGPGLFDIVQNMGMLYHVRDVMFALAQTRSVLKTGGLALIETAVILDDSDSYMVLNGYPQHCRIYPDSSTWWAMTVPCLSEMLHANCLAVQANSVRALHQYTNGDRQIGRVALVAQAIKLDDLPFELAQEARHTYRTPGLDLRQW